MSTLMTPDAPPTDGTPAPTPSGESTTPPPASGESTTPASSESPAATSEPTPPAAPVVPETYTLALAENSALDASLLERASSLAKELKLTNDAAQRVVSTVESELTQQLEVIRAADAPNGELWKARVAQYEKDALADPALAGGNPAELTKIAQRARLVAEKVGGKDIIEFLGATGMGSHPAFLKMFGVTLHKAFGEGTIVQPNTTTSAGSRDPAAILYGGKSASTQE